MIQSTPAADFEDSSDANNAGQSNGTDPIRLSPGRVRARFWRMWKERAIVGSLSACGLFTIGTTIAILFVLFRESWAFFAADGVTVKEFVTGTQWSPLLGSTKHFGVWPLVMGTLVITGVAMMVALPLGLITAIYLSEYAPRRLRAALKPTLEVLAGIPTVVFGYFALKVITPSLQLLNPLFGADGQIGVFNALSAGIAVGLLCIPIVSSLTEDALQAVPKALREGALGLGATRFEVSIKVVVPAALSGIIAAFLLAIARAIGETMIVALAAGSRPQMTADPRAEMQPMTGYMVQIFLGDASNFGPEYFSCYAVALTLFAMTLVLTLAGAGLRARYREVYE